MGSLIPKPGMVPAESKSPSLTLNFGVQSQYRGLHLQFILIIMLLAVLYIKIPVAIAITETLNVVANQTVHTLIKQLGYL